MKSIFSYFIVLVTTSIFSQTTLAACQSLMGNYKCSCTDPDKAILCNSNIQISENDGVLTILGAPRYENDSNLPLPINGASFKTVKEGSPIIGIEKKISATCSNDEVTVALTHGELIVNTNMGIRRNLILTKSTLKMDGNNIIVKETFSDSLSESSVLKVSGVIRGDLGALSASERPSYESVYSCNKINE